MHPGTLSETRQLSVRVASTHALVDESVRVALRARGYVVHDRARVPTSDCAEAGLLVVHDVEFVASAAGVLWEHASIPWLVMAPVKRGPVWGAFYAGGAALVVPPSVSLDEICRLLEDLAANRRPRRPRGRRELIRQWHEEVLSREAVDRRLTTLSAREHQVLCELYDGAGVSDIATRSSVSEATVRTQVKSILRKLQVSSQLAAVAALARSRSADQG